MRLNFSTSWIFRGWIACLLVTFYAQNADSKSLQCDDKHYLKGSRCCKKCQPGHYVYSHCTDSLQTICFKCNNDEYQPDWNEEKVCFKQKFCDEGVGFMKMTVNLIAEETCRCYPGFQCSSINCEYCEKIPTCPPGEGLQPTNHNDRVVCKPCPKGFFSTDDNTCKQWTSCKADGKRQIQPGSAKADAVCKPQDPVSVLSVITVLCLLILLLFCYKDKMKLLSVNLRSCVQNLKRTRIQQETLAPLYHSGAGGGIGGGPGSPKPCEMTELIYQAPSSPADDPPCTLPTSVPDIKVFLPFTKEMTGKEVVEGKMAMEEQSKGSGEPEEVSEEEKEVVSVSRLLAGSCICVIPIREPLEVGENEDCSKAVSPGTLGSCSCRWLDGERDGDGSGKEDKNDNKRADKSEEKGDGNLKKVILSTSETGVAPLVSLSPPLLHTSSAVPSTSQLPELFLPLSQVSPEFKFHLAERSPVKWEGLYRLTSTDSTSTEHSTTSAMTLGSPSMPSSSVGELYMDKPPEATGPEQDQGGPCEDSGENKLSSQESEMECSPESLHSHLADPNLTSGQVSGNHNTTFISSGQVMNFSGDVIVVCVSQTSHGSDEVGQDDGFGNPVQEEASETAPFFQSSLRSQGNSITHCTLQDETLPVQEVMVERSLGK
ncbi:tumor necrosis factor receptor superfamily member 11A isoform X2 [Archocentrus centrarchus]|uniref:tumor necrosis factor receptor superfamily member 11A isoform X2 n=1 Tax=Archocentrus centrarchus TaxID=63155 RepID=UPI0011E9C3B7|nr:tumor necrosis factor receptor superfamily member 11A-like isoform X2 [Archocentrus centrarchus]